MQDSQKNIAATEAIKLMSEGPCNCAVGVIPNVETLKMDYVQVPALEDCVSELVCGHVFYSSKDSATDSHVKPSEPQDSSILSQHLSQDEPST